jgi:hypothetical protein
MRVHIDICGELNTGIGGVKYFFIIVDDYSRYSTIYSLHNKNEALSCFKEFKAVSENIHNSRIQFIRCDNAPELMQGDFENFAKDSGVSYEKIVPDASQQNGVAERHNFTFHNMCRSMLLDADLSDWFWPLAIQAAVHIKNRVPHKALPRHTSPYELWNNTKPSLEHLHPFGAHCVSCVIPVKSLTKFQPRGEYGRFMGYAKDSTGYLFWNPSSRTLRVRRDLNFFSSPPPLPIGNGGGCICARKRPKPRMGSSYHRKIVSSG